MIGRHVASNKKTSFANVASGSAKNISVSPADIQVTVVAKSVAAPGANNQVGNGASSGGVGDANRDGAPAAKNNPAGNGASNGGAGDASRNRPGVRVRSMTGRVAYLGGDRGYIKSDEGGEDFFFWVRGNGIRWGDKVDFKFDPSAHFRASYYKRRAFSVFVMRASERQDAAVLGSDWHTVGNRRRDMTVVRPREKEDVFVQLRRTQSELAKTRRDLDASERSRMH